MLSFRLQEDGIPLHSLADVLLLSCRGFLRINEYTLHLEKQKLEEMKQPPKKSKVGFATELFSSCLFQSIGSIDCLCQC